MKQSKKEWSSVSPSSKSDSAHSRRSHSEDIFSPIKFWTFRDAQWRTHPATRFTLSMPCTHGDTTSPKPTSLLHGIFWTPLTPQVPRGSSFFCLYMFSLNTGGYQGKLLLLQLERWGTLPAWEHVKGSMSYVSPWCMEAAGGCMPALGWACTYSRPHSTHVLG